MADDKKGLKYFEDLGATVAETAPPPSSKVQQGAMPPTGTAAPSSSQQRSPETDIIGKSGYSVVREFFGWPEIPKDLKASDVWSTSARLAKSMLSEPSALPERKTTGTPLEMAEGVVREGMLAIPGQVMTMIGIDPSKVKVPYAPKFKSRKQFDEFILKGGEGWKEPSEITPSDLVTGEAEKKEKERETFRSIGQAPDTPMGKIGGMIGTGLQFVRSRGALGMPALEAKTFATFNKLLPNYPIFARTLAQTANSIADGALTAFQTFSKTMDPSEALSNAGWATLIDMGVNRIPSTAKWVIDSQADELGNHTRKLTWDYWMKSALPWIEKRGKDEFEYQRTLANKMGERKYDFSKSGVKRLESEFETTWKSMEKASKDADEIANELYKMKAIPPEGTRLVDYGSEVRNAIYGLQEDGKPLFKKIIGPKGVEIYEPIPGGFAGKQMDAQTLERVRKAAAEIDAVMPKEYKVDANGNVIPKYKVGRDGKPIEISKDANGRPVYEQEVDEFGYPQYETTDKNRSITFEEAEYYKKRINRTIEKLYNSGQLNPSDMIDKQVKLLYGDAIRKAQQKAFDLLEQTKNTYDHFIPSNSPVKNLRPGYVKLPWMKIPIKYSDTGKEAMELADLYTVGKIAQKEYQPHLGAKSGADMPTMIAIAQLIHGSFLTPSQLATTYAEAAGAVGSSLRAKKFKGISNLIGKTQTVAPHVSRGFAGARSTTPPSMTEWVRQQAAPASQNSSINYDRPLDQ